MNEWAKTMKKKKHKQSTTENQNCIPCSPLTWERKGRKNFSLSVCLSVKNLSEDRPTKRASPVVALEPPLQTLPVEEKLGVELAHLLLRLEPAQAHAAGAAALACRCFTAHYLEPLHVNPPARRSSAEAQDRRIAGFSFGRDAAGDGSRDGSPGALHVRHREGRVHQEQRQEPFCCYREARQPHCCSSISLLFSTFNGGETCLTLQYKWLEVFDCDGWLGAGHVATSVRLGNDSGMLLGKKAKGIASKKKKKLCARVLAMTVTAKGARHVASPFLSAGEGPMRRRHLAVDAFLFFD